MQDTDKSQGYRLARWIGLVMGLPALIAVMLLGQNAMMAVDRIDESALKRETAALEHGLTLLGELNAAGIVSLSLWDTAYRNIVLSRRPEWIRRNFGRDALSSDMMQQLVIVDGAGRAIFSSTFEAAPPLRHSAALLAAAGPSMERARTLYRAAREAGDGFGERMAGAMTDGLYVNDIIRLNDHPAMLTVSPITPDTEHLPTPDSPFLLLGVQEMAGPLLEKLAALSHIEGLVHVSQSGATETERQHAHAVRDSQGNFVTHVTWEISSPGYAIMRAVLPAVASSLALIALMTLLGALTMRRLTRQLADSEEAALHASRHDAATGLANRGWFIRVLSTLLDPAHQPARHHAALLIDCDYFKSVNDTLGHAAGDAVLIAIGARLRSLKESVRIAARLGGDEFALVSGPLDRPEDIGPYVRRVEAALTKPVLFEAHVIVVSVSIGAVMVETPSASSLDEWLAKADTALYRAKRDGRGCARIYDAVLDGGDATGAAARPYPANDRGKAGQQAA